MLTNSEPHYDSETPKADYDVDNNYQEALSCFLLAIMSKSTDGSIYSGK